MNRTRYTYTTGTPSWHQSRAGATSAGQITCDHTPEEHAAFVARYRERGEPVTWTAEAPLDTHPDTVSRLCRDAERAAQARMRTEGRPPPDTRPHLALDMTTADSLAAAARADLAAYGAALRDCLEIAWPYLVGIAAILLYMHRKI